MRDATQHEDSLSPDVMTSTKTLVVFPVIEETLVVDKRVVDHGGFRIVKSVSEREGVIDESLVSTAVHVERRAIGRLLPSMEVPASRQEGNTLIVSIVEEVLVTEKRLMLKEELHITRTEQFNRHSQTFSLRSEDVTIEPLDPGIPPVAGTL